jgi:aminopeptidase-like protein
VLKSAPRRWTYRFLFIPGHIGAITWLARNPDASRRIVHGLVLAAIGDRGKLTYKRSRRGDAAIDRAVEHMLNHCGAPYEIQDFVPYGYDERQYCSPGFDLPVGCLTRTSEGGSPERHTSADDLSLITSAHLGEAFARLFDVVQILEDDRTYLTENPCCEPQLESRGLGRVAVEGGNGRNFGSAERALLWVLNQSDGMHSLLDIARRADIPFGIVRRAAVDLVTARLLREKRD